MGPRQKAAFVLVSLWAGQAVAAEVETLQLDLSADMGWSTRDGGSVQQELTLEPAVEGLLTDNLDFRVSARVRADARDELEPRRPDLRTYSSFSRPATLGTVGTAELRDAYVDAILGPARMRLGKQQIVWGSLDGFKILDALNPQSFREFILDGFPDSRIGLWAASLEWPMGAALAQVAWAPDPTVHELPRPDAYFAFRAPRFRFGAPIDSPAPDPAVVNRPDDAWKDGAVGARIRGFTDGWDWSVVALSGLNPRPYATVELTGDGPALAHNYRRRELYGFSFARSFGNTALRGEAAIRPDLSYNTRTEEGLLGVTRQDNISAALGTDIDAPGDVFLSTQLFVDHVRDPAPGLVRPETDWIFTLFARKMFLYQTLRTELKWYASLTDGDGVVRPAISYAVSDNLSLRLGADVFYGDGSGIFGQFADQDRVILGLDMTL
ncbi:MAG: hypothetical protein P8080_09565 [Gammaproteobacteria bacterium]